MRGDELGVEQGEPAEPQPRDQVHQRHLRGVPHPAEHAFAEKRPTDRHPVEAADQVPAHPAFHRMGVAHAMQRGEQAFDVGIDPGLPPPRAGPGRRAGGDGGGEIGIDRHQERVGQRGAQQSPRQVEGVERQNSAQFGVEPEQVIRRPGLRHREKPGLIGPQHQFGRNLLRTSRHRAILPQPCAPRKRADIPVAPDTSRGWTTTERETALPSPRYIGAEIYRRSSYGPKHPLAIPRVSTCTDLIRALGWLDEAVYHDAPIATLDQLERFHTPDYLAALQRAEATQSVSPEDRARYRIGADGNPVYREVFSRPATSAGGVMLAARLTRDGGVVHCPGGGTHHGRPDRASGFCYLNDSVLGILTWLDAGLERIVYLDIDAHHGDGVQDAFHDDPRVLTISIHEANRWPNTGLAEDRAGGVARNFPVPAGFNDSEMRHVMTRAVLPLIRAFRPEAIMLQSGADALEEDPLARLSLSNNVHAGVALALRPLAPRLLVTGGGGYNPYTTARCWAGVWGALNGHTPPDRLPEAAEAILRDLGYNRAAGRNPPEHWFTTLRDPPREGPIRDSIRDLAAIALKDPLRA